MNKLEKSIVSLAQEDAAEIKSHLGKTSFSIADDMSLSAAREGAMKLVMLALFDSGLSEETADALRSVEREVNEAYSAIGDARLRDSDPAYEAVLFATSLEPLDGMNFLRTWREADMDAIRAKWPEAPEGVFVGYDFFHTPSDDFQSSPKTPQK